MTPTGCQVKLTGTLDRCQMIPIVYTGHMLQARLYTKYEENLSLQ